MQQLEVHIVKWPEEREDRERHARARALCLLVVDVGDLPPSDLRVTEDWVRASADPIEVHSRIERIRALNPLVVGRPAVDADGILTFGERWLPLSPGDASLVAALCANYGGLVHREHLRALVPGLTDASLSVRLHRLRRQLAPLGLAVTTVRARGYILDPMVPGDGASVAAMTWTAR
jgi:hypothetical protein